MKRVENFRLLTLYDRSIELTKTIYDVSHTDKGSLTDLEIKLIRKKAVIIPSKIASGISQMNMKFRCKKLNEAKATLIQLRLLMDNLKMRKKIDCQLWLVFEKYRIEVIKLLNGYFGWIGSKK
jgi:hypothetical protein